MSILASLIDAYRIAPERIRFWDATNSRFNNAVGTDSHTVLAEHVTQHGWIGVLTHWQLYYRPLPTVAPVTPGDLYFLTDEVGCFFTVERGGNALPGLNEIRQVQTPWGSNIYPADGGSFYMSEFGAPRTRWRVTFSIGAGLPHELFHVAARIVGFDFPREFLDRSEVPGTTGEQILGRERQKLRP